MGFWIYNWNITSDLIIEIKEILRKQDEIISKTVRSKQAFPIDNGDKYPDLVINQHIETPIYPYHPLDSRVYNLKLFDFKEINNFE